MCSRERCWRIMVTCSIATTGTKPPSESSRTPQPMCRRPANIALIVRREEELHEALATKVLTPRDVAGLDDDEARHLRNEIYARHGRRFKDPKLQRYFSSFAWYKPNDGFRESQLSDIEKSNA